RRTDSPGSASRSTSSSTRPGRSPRERGAASPAARRDRAGLALAPDARRPLPDHLQIPPDVLGVRGAGTAQARPLQGKRARRLAACALQPVEPRGLRPDPMILFTFPVISQLEDVMRHVLNFFHTNLGLTWAWSIVVTTVVVRIILVPLTIRQIDS